MGELGTFLVSYGYWGMLVAAFLAGSVFPFSSEAIMLALMAAGLRTPELIAFATVGNVAGSMFNYCIGRMGKTEWIERYLHVKQKNMDRARRFMAGRGAWMGFFAFLPIIGSAITLTLGYMRANITVSLISITLGKWSRYLVLAYGVEALFHLF